MLSQWNTDEPDCTTPSPSPKLRKSCEDVHVEILYITLIHSRVNNPFPGFSALYLIQLFVFSQVHLLFHITLIACQPSNVFFSINLISFLVLALYVFVLNINNFSLTYIALSPLNKCLFSAVTSMNSTQDVFGGVESIC